MWYWNQKSNQICLYYFQHFQRKNLVMSSLLFLLLHHKHVETSCSKFCSLFSKVSIEFTSLYFVNLFLGRPTLQLFMSTSSTRNSYSFSSLPFNQILLTRPYINTEVLIIAITSIQVMQVILIIISSSNQIFISSITPENDTTSDSLFLAIFTYYF